MRADVEQRISALDARIYSHQNLINNITAEKEKLLTFLENLDQDAAPVPETMVIRSGVEIVADGPFK